MISSSWSVNSSSLSPAQPGSAAQAVAAALTSTNPVPPFRKPPTVSNGPISNGNTIRGPCFLKLLVPDRMAGVIIGKGGSGIAELEQETGANMRLSGNRIYFPGTSERVMVCGGDQLAIDKMIEILVSKLNDPESPQFSIRMILTNSACSAIIGKGGEVIKAISQQTGSTIRASDRIETPAHERIVDIKAQTANAVIATVHEIVVRIQEDISFRESVSVLNYYQPQIVMPPESSYYYPNNPSALAAAAAAAGAQSAGLGRPGAPPTAVGISALVDQYPITIDFTVPSGAVGAIIGKNGEARNRIVHSTGANVVVSERTTDTLADRKISISGPLAAVQAALTLVAKLVVESQ